MIITQDERNEICITELKWLIKNIKKGNINIDFIETSSKRTYNPFNEKQFNHVIKIGYKT